MCSSKQWNQHVLMVINCWGIVGCLFMLTDQVICLQMKLCTYTNEIQVKLTKPDWVNPTQVIVPVIKVNKVNST